MFSRYLLHYILSYYQHDNDFIKFAGVGLVCLFVGLIGLGRFNFYWLLAALLVSLLSISELNSGFIGRKNLPWHAQPD